MFASKQLSANDDPAGTDKEKAIEEIVHNADLKKFDPELEKAVHEKDPNRQSEWRVSLLHANGLGIKEPGRLQAVSASKALPLLGS